MSLRASFFSFEAIARIWEGDGEKVRVDIGVVRCGSDFKGFGFVWNEGEVVVENVEVTDDGVANESDP